MRRRFVFLASPTIPSFLLYANSAVQADLPYLKPNDILPPLVGQTLTGKWLDMASVFGDNLR